MNPYIKTDPKKWNDQEVQQLLELVKTHTNQQVADIMGRNLISIKAKLKKVRKKLGEYNEKHLQEKYELNDKFMEILKPKTILDAFSGKTSYYEKYQNAKITTNDINENNKAQYHLDYLKLLCKLYYENNKYELVDLDPYGSAYDGIDLAIKMATRGFIITLGEIGHKRFSRLDFVRNRYGIQNLNEFTIDKMIEKVKAIGLANKKKLIIVFQGNWQNISRVYFLIENIKITEQWDKKKEKDKIDIFND
jgi:hypothetical protein